MSEDDRVMRRVLVDFILYSMMDVNLDEHFSLSHL